MASDAKMHFQETDMYFESRENKDDRSIIF